MALERKQISFKQSQGYAGIHIPYNAGWFGETTNQALTQNVTYVTAFTVDEPTLATKISITIGTAAGANDEADLFIHNGAGTAALASSGAVAGKMNAGGVQTFTLTSSVWLSPSTRYLCGLSTKAVFGGSAPAVTCIIPNATANTARLYGATASTAEFFSHTGGGTVPTTLTPAATTIGMCFTVRTD